MIREEIAGLDDDKIVFYDLETDHQYAAYAKLKTCAVAYGMNDRVHSLQTKADWREFRQKMRSPDIIKVDFNGVNFDTIVCERHGIKVHRQNHHDVFLMFKTVGPTLPAYGQKFLAFYYLCDPHFPEMELYEYMAEHGVPMWKAPRPLLLRYNRHDIVQLRNLFRVVWDVVIRSEYWDAYLEDLLMGEPLLEMETEGGIYLDRDAVWTGLHRLQKKVQKETSRALTLTRGHVQNPNSSQQLARYFTHFDQIELALTDSGEFSVKKSVLVSLRESNDLADCAFNIREANGTIKFFENYLNALDDETYNEIHGENWIPVQFSVSSARTRRFTSQSLYRLNFQNPNSAAKSVQIIPPGQLGWWFDATQIENVVHIYESDDRARRMAYEADPDWNEYVWLCNRILQADKSKDELDDITISRSPQIPHWTLYKQYKTGKLGINFGMGIDLFCNLFGLAYDVGQATFEDIHTACPTIRSLVQRVARNLASQGYVEDVFGKRYSGPVNQAYKVVAYLIQGCGTGSLPKAQIRANWETLRRFDRYVPARIRKTIPKCGVMCGTTHDENGGRIQLHIGEEPILKLLRKINFNMTDKFSHKFDDIPLRAKCYLSKTTADKAIECDINDTDKILTIINGDACPTCGGAGYIGKANCNDCKSIGYIL